ncbi:MAG: type II toxin-antitoxin system VapC family toxin [Gemmatimonadales bacterium]
MIVYAESSAVLAWLLGEPTATAVRTALGGAERVVSSSLTAVECARALARGRASGRVTSRDELAALRLLDVATGNWDVHDLTERVLSRARLPFPVEPVRTSDALHLATAAIFLEAIGQLSLLSLDERVLANGSALGMAPALPARR